MSKKNTLFSSIWGKAVKGLFIASIMVIATYIVVEVAVEIRHRVQLRTEYRRQQSLDYCHEYWNHQLSHDVIFHEGTGDGYIYNKQLGRRTVINLYWICVSEDNSLVCFSNGERRGYFDRYTGELVIPAQYEKAWVFSEGLACVMFEGKLGFIDPEGHWVIDPVFEWAPYIGNYCFHHGLCLMSDGHGRMGLIDKQGKWSVEPRYEFMDGAVEGYWRVADSCWRWGLIDDTGRAVLPCEYAYLSMDNQYLHTRTEDHLEQVFDMEGKMVNSCDYYDIQAIEYPTGEYDDYGSPKMADARCLKYCTSDFHCGLMNRDGRNITLPLYTDIRAISEDRFVCDGPVGTIILDDRGRECGGM